MEICVRPLAVLTLLFCLAGGASARDLRERAAFQRENPCPATGQRRGGCPGYVVDHLRPLCAGGVDHRSNMQWQTVRDAHAKDIDEWRECRALRKRAR